MCIRFVAFVAFSLLMSWSGFVLAKPPANPAFQTQIASDDFDRANLDLNRWTFVNPLDDGWIAMTGNNTTDAYLELSVPAGPTHDPWQNNNRSVRVMQSAADTDFEVEVKFASEPDPSQAYQLQGIIVEESNNNWLRFDLFSNGSGLRVFAATTVNGSSSSKINATVNPGDATYLKVSRLGNTWTYAYSGDGSTWTTAGSFSHTMAVGSIGPFAANHGSGGNNAPAYTAQVDYFFDTASPLASEDNGAEPDTWSPFVHTMQPQAAVNSLTITWYTDEPSIGAVDLGLTTAYGSTQAETVAGYVHSLTFPGMIAGNTYHYRVRSEDNLNQESISQDFTISFNPEGPEIEVWYGDNPNFGQLGNPQEFWANVFGHVSDLDGISSLSYTLNGGNAVSLSIGPDGRRLENTGDFNIDLNWTTLNAGANTVVITATDGLGNVSTKTVPVNYTAGNVWPLPYTADWSTLTTDGDPATPDPEIQTLSQVVDGKWSVDNGLIRTAEPGYDRLVAIGDYLLDDYEALVPITINSLKTSGFGVGLLFRWNGHTNTPVSCFQPKCGYEPLGAIGWFRNNKLEFYQGVSQSFSPSLGTTYWMRMRVENSGSNPVYSLKVWEDGQAEPANWNLTQTEGPGTPQNGSLLLIAHQADASFGTVVVTPIQGTPNVAPVANNDNASVVTGGSVSVNVLNNDSDTDGSLAPATVTVVDPPDHGIITGINFANGAITYDHNGSPIITDDFTYTVEDNDGAVSNIATVNISVSSTPVQSFISDDFCNGVLDPAWTFVDPLSDGTLQLTGANTSDAWVEISVPAGVEHQLWENGIEAPHLIQAASDTDFEIEVKFESPVNAPQYQEQGVLVKQDDFNFLRFEIYSSNSATRVLAGILQPGSNPSSLSASLPINGQVGSGSLNLAPLYMRVKRVGDLWTQSYSTDGITFTPAGTFTHNLTVTGVGIYGGNATGNGSPAHTAKFDYFENVLVDPIASEDGCGSTTFTLTYDGNGNDGGTAPVDLNSPYMANATVTVLGPGTLTQTGYDFAGWNTQADGLGTSYAVFSTFAITANTTLYAQWNSTATQSFISDDFCNGVLDPAWTFVDPLSDGTLQLTGANTSDAWVEISVPAGVEHQLWTSGIQAPHLIQAASDTDFEIEVKFESPVNAPQYQEQGVLVKQDDFNFLRFEIYSSNSKTMVLAGILQPGSNPSSLNSSLPINGQVGSGSLNVAPIYMRVKRVGDLWTQSYSTDGITFTPAGTFTHNLTVTGVGIYGGNAIGSSSPAHTAKFDYFENVLDDPIASEDGCSSTTFTLTYDGNGNDGGTAPVDVNSPYMANATVTVLGPGALTQTGYDFAGWNTQADGLGTSYAVSSTFAITANTTLYAQWTLDTDTDTDNDKIPDFVDKYPNDNTNNGMGAIYSRAWNDRNGNGRQGAGEEGVGSLTVKLKKGGSTLGTAVTNPFDGGVAFFDIPIGNTVYLDFDLPSGYAYTLQDANSNNKDLEDSDVNRSNGKTPTFTVNGTGVITKWDAGVWAPGSVKAYVWDDQNGNGRQGTNEPAVQGVTVKLKRGGSTLGTATTDANGEVLFDGIVPADVDVYLDFDIPAGYAYTLKDANGNNKDLEDSDADRANGKTATFKTTKGSHLITRWDAGVWAPGSVKAYVWDDQNGNGRQGTNEPAVQGVTVKLKRGGSTLGTTTTDVNGEVLFDGIVPADVDVYLDFDIPAGYAYTLKDANSNNKDLEDSDADRANGKTATFKTTKGSHLITRWDAGVWAPGSVKAYVWDDQNGNGRQGTDEPAVQGVTVKLKRGGSTLGTATTDVNGEVLFDGIVPADADVYLDFDLPAGYAYTHKDANSNNKDLEDSDADRANGKTATFKTTKGSHLITRWDAGVWAPGSVKAYVWEDLNGNGRQGSTEPPVAGIPVKLKRGGSTIQTLNTDVNGEVFFQNNVPADVNVYLDFDLPSGYSYTIQDANSNNKDLEDSDANLSDGKTAQFKTTKGSELITKWDAGVINNATNSRIANLEVIKDLRLYPVPASDILNVEMEVGVSLMAQYQIVDLAGKVILRKQLRLEEGTTSLKIPVRELANGYYVFHVLTAEGMIHKHFVILR